MTPGNLLGTETDPGSPGRNPARQRKNARRKRKTGRLYQRRTEPLTNTNIQPTGGAGATPAPPRAIVELIDLASAIACPIDSKMATVWRSQERSLLICETHEQKATADPLRTYRWSRQPGPEWPEATPIRVYMRTDTGADARFEHDVDDDHAEKFSYAGWLPLALYRHPDGRGRHQAITAGDHWAGTPETGRPRPAPGILSPSLTAGECSGELHRRGKLEAWNQEPPGIWPLQGDGMRRILREVVAALRSATRNLDRAIAEDSDETIASGFAGERSREAVTAAARVLCVRADTENTMSIIRRMRIFEPGGPYTMLRRPAP